MLITTIVIGLVALLHLYFLVLEIFFWTKPLGRRVFGLTPVIRAGIQGARRQSRTLQWVSGDGLVLGHKPRTGRLCHQDFFSRLCHRGGRVRGAHGQPENLVGAGLARCRGDDVGLFVSALML